MMVKIKILSLITHPHVVSNRDRPIYRLTDIFPDI